MKLLKIARDFHGIYDVLLIIKGIDGILECIGGFLLLLIKPAFLNSIVALLTQHELAQDPTDPFSNFLVHAVFNLSSGSRLFGVFYLLGHGLLKILIAYNLLKENRWAYPLSAIVLSIFSAYQLFRFSHTHSIFLLLATFLDILIIILLALEYQSLPKKA